MYLDIEELVQPVAEVRERDLAQGRLRAKLPQLERALTDQFQLHQRFLVAHRLAYLDGLEELIEQLSEEIAQRLRPVQDKIARLDAISGVGQRTVEVLSGRDRD